MSVDSPKEGKARRKVTPAPAFEEDIVDGISIRAFNAPESVKVCTLSFFSPNKLAESSLILWPITLNEILIAGISLNSLLTEIAR